MKLYCKVENPETKEVSIGTGIDISFFKSLGMEFQDVEKSLVDGKWYLAGYSPQPSLASLKAEKKAELNATRDSVEQGGFTYLDKVFDSDPISCQRMSCAAQAMALVPLTEGEPEPTITWTCQDNSTIDLSPAELMGLVAALAQHSNSCHQRAKALKAYVDAAKTAEEVAAIGWDYVPPIEPEEGSTMESVNSILEKA